MSPPLRAYRNPILPGFHPDPSICRVGPDFYLVTSSFQWFPGVPIYHSQDLIHWDLINYCLTRPSQLPLENAPPSGGIFAPTLRHHQGTFYMITTNWQSGGNFYVTTKDIRGPWSEPVWLPLPGIDPSLFFDEDGKVYAQSTGDGQGIVQAELDVATGKLLGEPKLIWPGTGGRYPEGPHLYKIHGHYYLMIAEGGTEYGHMETMARSHSPWGPFESCPHNPILTHRDLGGHAIQGTGHADIVQDTSGQWWIVFLGFRPTGGHFHHLGRETFLAPVTWTPDQWPLVNQGQNLELKMQAPLPVPHPLPTLPIRDDFDHEPLDLIWNFIRNPEPAAYSLTARTGFLRLLGQPVSLDDTASPTLIARRQQHFSLRASAWLEFEPEQNNEEAGLTVLMDECHHIDLFVTKRDGHKVIGLKQRIGGISAMIREIQVPAGPLVLHVLAQPDKYQFRAEQPGKEPWLLGEAKTKYLSSEVAGGFTGVYIGLYATGHGQACRTPADFDWFEYKGEG